MVSDMDVAVLALSGLFDTGLASVLDTLAIANALAPSVGSRAPFRVRCVGVRARVRTGHGLHVPVAPAARTAPPDLVVVPAISAFAGDQVDAILARPDVVDAAALLARWHAAGAVITGACAASFVIAAAGLLDGQRATTTWWLAPAFRARFPGTELDAGAMLVATRTRVVTAGAALGHLDLALHIVRGRRPSLARAVSHHLTHEARASQAAHALPAYVAHGDPLVEAFEAYARAHLARFTLTAAARALGVGERTLERHVDRVLGASPLSFVRDLRVEYAVRELATGASIDDIATAVGYRDGVTLRALLRDKLGRGVRELRAAAAASR